MNNLQKRTPLSQKNYHKVLGLSPGATKKQIKSAYRQLALKYHPDRNKSAGAARRFQEITEAYDYLLEHPDAGLNDARSYDDLIASEILRREREKMKQRARARREKKKQQDEYFQRPEWHDPVLILKYIANGLLLLFALSAVILPVILAVFGDPESLAGTSIIMIMGIVLLVFIYQKRKRWFRLGKLNTSWKEILNFFRLVPGPASNDWCCYCRSTMADGKPHKIELLKTVDILIQSYGALNHSAKYKNKVKRVVVPRSSRAQFYHRLASLMKLMSLLVFLIVFPVTSILWRFIAGLFAAGILSAVFLKLAGVRSKVSYLLTPGLIVKACIWLISMALISKLGPGFDIQVSSYVYLVIAGLFFFLDMLFDLLFGFLPFYRKMFRPLTRQGVVLDSLYRDGFQNYQELPVFSVVYPLVRWFF
jgi:hypothetical protein